LDPRVGTDAQTVEARDAQTVVLHLKHADNFLADESLHGRM